MLIPQYQVLVLKLSPIYTVSLNTVFSIPQNQCYPGTPCNIIIIISTFDSTFEMSFTASLTADTFRKLGHVATPFVQKHISFAKFVNVSCFSDRNSDWNSKRMLKEFWRNSRRILKKLWENSGKILEEFQKNSRRILEKLRKNSGGIPWSYVYFQRQF